MSTERLTLEEFSKKVSELDLSPDYQWDILPVMDKSQIPDLPDNTEPGSCWIEDYDFFEEGLVTMLEGTFVCEHYRGGKLVETTRTPIRYEETRPDPLEGVKSLWLCM
jgi:hypothetical protein